MPPKPPSAATSFTCGKSSRPSSSASRPRPPEERRGNPLTSTSSEIIAGFFPDAECVSMNKSYRSAVEITRFALGVLPNPDIIPIERHGEAPEVVACGDVVDEIETIREWIDEFAASGRQSLGILCKTQMQADLIFDEVEDMHEAVHLLDAKSTLFEGGVVVATAHLVKGLEFDEVIIPEASAENYRSEIDRQMLYVSSTRAMHRLRLSHIGAPSPLLPRKTAPSVPSRSSAPQEARDAS